MCEDTLTSGGGGLVEFEGKPFRSRLGAGPQLIASLRHSNTNARAPQPSTKPSSFCHSLTRHRLTFQ
jgi:hypothetical protein